MIVIPIALKLFAGVMCMFYYMNNFSSVDFKHYYLAEGLLGTIKNPVTQYFPVYL